MEKKVYTIDEVQSITGIGRTKIYESINSGILRAKKFGRKTLILLEDLDDFLNQLASYEVNSYARREKGKAFDGEAQ